MQLYFVKATYTNNVYKLSDFFLSGDYKEVATKMINANFIPNDGRTSFITSTLTLPDTTSIRDHTHIIVPDYEKIYKIEQIEYVNKQQWRLYLIDDPAIGSYLDYFEEDIFLYRSNDPDYFRGQNDVADLSLLETVVTEPVYSSWNTGKWALLFFQMPTPSVVSDYIGLSFEPSGIIVGPYLSSYAVLLATYPEVTTDYPEKYDYFQKIIWVVASTQRFQCVYDGTGLKWVDYNTVSGKEIYVKTQNYGAQHNDSDVVTFCVALPFETDLYTSTFRLIDYNSFTGPKGTDIIDIKIVNDLIFDKDSISYSLSGTTMTKTITPELATMSFLTCYSDTACTVATGEKIAALFKFEQDLDVGKNLAVATPKDAEPFYKYELYVYGQRFSIPYYLMDDIHLLIAINSGVINYTLYHVDKRNIIGSGSFTHSIKYSIDQLETFYSENPTYKDQFYLKMGGNAFKTVAGGAMAGGMAGPIGVAGGAATGLVTAGVDAGLSLANYKYMEQGLRLKPDQIYGETSEVALQLINIFSIYWVVRTPENKDLMLNEYYLKGFPTSAYVSIDDLDYATSVFGTSKVVFGEIKTVVKNEWTTNQINEKLKQGIILVP